MDHESKRSTFLSCNFAVTLFTFTLFRAVFMHDSGLLSSSQTFFDMRIVIVENT